MSSRVARRESRRQPKIQRPRKSKRSRTLLAWLGGSFALVLVILVVLVLADVRLGQGYFAIRYSPFPDWRLERTLPVLIFGTIACGAVWAMTHRERMYRRAGLGLLALASVGAGVWMWWAPPDSMSQQTFNMRSFSTDGAFLFEASKVRSLPDYLQDFPAVLQQSPERMGGTRVLSNPPLVTILSYALCYAWRDDPRTPDRFERMLIDRYETEPRDVKEVADALRMSAVLCGIWVLSGWAAYLLGRCFLSPAGAAVFAIIITFNPCTAHFVPGKDPGQLLTINLALWAWFSAWQRRSLLRALLGGAILTIGSTSGLVHIWVGLIAVAATLWQDWKNRTAHAVLWNALAAMIGGAIVCVVAYATWGWNIPVTLLAVSRRWTELQGTFVMSRPIWYAIGLPIFLLFLSPGFWALLGLNLRRLRLRFGTRLVLCTAAVMLLIYGPLGVTYELPRLWTAFLPTLALGLAIDRPLLRADSSHARAARALVLIAGMQIAFTALHWTLFDARESEYRLSTKRFFH